VPSRRVGNAADDHCVAVDGDNACNLVLDTGLEGCRVGRLVKRRRSVTGQSHRAGDDVDVRRRRRRRRRRRWRRRRWRVQPVERVGVRHCRRRRERASHRQRQRQRDGQQDGTS